MPPITLIVGAGQAGLQVAASLRTQGYGGEIALLGAEAFAPYQRPPLSKTYLAEGWTDDRLSLKDAAFFEREGIELHLQTRAVRIDREARMIETVAQGRLAYDWLVLATGATPRPLPVTGGDLPGVVMLRDLPDAQLLRERFRDVQRVVVVGGGFIGLEVAATAAKAGLDVRVVELQNRVMARAVSETISAYFETVHGRSGVVLYKDARVTHLEGDDAVRAVHLDDGTRLTADLVIAGIGIQPRDDLAAACGLDVQDGICVDGSLRTNDARIFAIGDCARFPSPFSDAPVRLESVQNAIDQARYVAGLIAAEAAGDGTAKQAAAPYAAIPWFWSDQFERKLQIAGLIAYSEDMITKGAPEADAFSVCHFRGDRLVAVESVNRPADHMAARRLLALETPPHISDVAGDSVALRDLAKR